MIFLLLYSMSVKEVSKDLEYGSQTFMHKDGRRKAILLVTEACKASALYVNIPKNKREGSYEFQTLISISFLGIHER